MPEIASRCPVCGARLVARVNRRTSETFLGCTRYPECRGSRNLTEREKMLVAGYSELPGFCGLEESE